MYTFLSALKSVIRSRFINLTVIVSLSLGLLFPMLVFCIGNIALKEVWAGVATYPERTASIHTNTIRIDTEKAMKDYSQIELMMEGSFVEYDYIVSGNKIVKTQTIGYKNGYDKIISFEMLDGKYFTESEANGNEHICLITSNLQKELGCHAGDKVVLGNEEFTVKGVYIRKDNTVLLPLESFAQKHETYYNYSLIFKKDCDIKTKGAEILKSLLEEYGLNTENYMLMGDYYEEHNDLKNAYFAIAIMLAIASVVLIYAALNISNIMVNKINNDMKIYKIRMQLGATKGNIFGFLWVQLFALMLIAVAADALIIFLLKTFMPFFAVFPFDLDFTAVFLTALIGTVYVLILSSVLVKRVFGKRRAAQ